MHLQKHHGWFVYFLEIFEIFMYTGSNVQLFQKSSFYTSYEYKTHNIIFTMIVWSSFVPLSTIFLNRKL